MLLVANIFLSRFPGVGSPIGRFPQKICRECDAGHGFWIIDKVFRAGIWSGKAGEILEGRFGILDGGTGADTVGSGK